MKGRGGVETGNGKGSEGGFLEARGWLFVIWARRD